MDQLDYYGALVGMADSMFLVCHQLWSITNFFQQPTIWEESERHITSMLNSTDSMLSVSNTVESLDNSNISKIHLHDHFVEIVLTEDIDYRVKTNASAHLR